MNTQELMGKTIQVKGYIQRVTFKEVNYQPGGFAIIKVDCHNISGELPDEFKAQYKIINGCTEP